MRKPTSIDQAFAAREIRNTDVAAAVGVTKQCVNAWRIGRNRINPTIAKQLHELYGLPLHVMRPDIWDPPSSRRRAA